MRDDEDRARAEAEDQAWRAIVEHYGEQPDVESLTELTTQPPPPPPEPVIDPDDAPFLVVSDDDEFTPPPLPPPPVISPERRLAWVGLIAAPMLLLVVTVLSYPLPGVLTFGLVIAFVASFGYLVATMAPRDPDDDGARV